MANPVTIKSAPPFINANTNVHNAWHLRRFVDGAPPGPGVFGYEDWRVLPRQTGANMSIDVGKTGVGLMQGWVRGSTRDGQGLYVIENIDDAAPTSNTFLPGGGQFNVDVSSNSSGNPRVDQVILEVLDAQHAGASNLAQIRVVAGTPSVGATLDNRTGAAALPASSLLLADIIVANGETTIDAVDIRDRRAFPLEGVVPPLLTDVEAVSFVPLASAGPVAYNSIDHNGTDTFQSAAAMYLPRRIPAATRMRWTYKQGATAMTGNYVIAIFDASGRKIVDTGSVAFTGAANAFLSRSETIAATSFEAGVYYVFIGLDSATVGASFNYLSVSSGPASPTSPNAFLSVTSGGVVVPTTLAGLSDGFAVSLGFRPAVPVVALSVG